MERIIVRVLDYTETPGPRFIHQGKFSGEDFYRKVLNSKMAECIERDVIMEVVLDGTAGYPSSFLDQAFGELVYDFSQEKAREKLEFKTSIYRRRVAKLYEETFPQWEIRRLSEPDMHSGDDFVNMYYINNVGQLTQR